MEKFNLDDLHEKLFELRDEGYKKFNEKLLPTVDGEKIIGVRSPQLHKLTKKFFENKNAEEFLNILPHKFFEENSIHSILISNMKNYPECLNAVNNFLPFVDNWAVCDSLVPKIFKTHTDELIKKIPAWLESEKIFTVRFGISMLMKFYLGENFEKKYLDWVANVSLKKYYVEMMAAWYFAEALIKQYDSTIIFLENNFLSESVHGKTIQKAVDSRRISAQTKNYLKSLRRGV